MKELIEKRITDLKENIHISEIQLRMDQEKVLKQKHRIISMKGGLLELESILQIGQKT